MKENFIPVRFFTAAFAWSWLFWLPLVLVGLGIISLEGDALTLISVLISVIGAFGPAFGAYVSIRTIQGKGAFRAFLKPFFSLRFGWKTWAALFLVLGLSTAAAWIIPEFFGEHRAPMLLPGIFIFPVYWLAMVFLGGGQEEIGWRGYILPFLEKRFGRICGSLVLSVIWACWHIPLWFVPGASQGYMNFFGFLMLTTGYSFFFAWVLRASGNRPLSALIAHGTANAFIPVFPVVIMIPGAAQPRFWLWVSFTLVIGIVTTAAGEISRRRGTASGG
ncbi:CPBP family intramembrane glutamic endopeptidase [Breznakiella homolactica]|uniref:CPBP family intramembrane metalloprotease n=1 Tax=Breznakiella homolactica TaxID=2798577 RepID=A0A7T7XM58_9SPIR|nr:type II CAAX endopeptidase family protein [Breznakiella homolactica]QQO08767.1 CPBP family intramembrane metalloprotease [Breznakiella homolactica]